jgi:hypothetical protein
MFRPLATSGKFYKTVGEHSLGVVIPSKAGCERQTTNREFAASVDKSSRIG